MTRQLGDVRTEDAFDIDAVHTWLLKNSDIPGDKPAVQQFSAGASNLTYLLTFQERELILRRPPVGTKAASAHDMKREFFIQKTLKPDFPIAPEVFALCQDQSVIGSDFYVMEKINGVIFRRNLPDGVNVEKDDMELIGNSVIDGLVALHHVDPTSLAQLSKGPGYVGRQVEGWSRRYRNALTPDVPDAEVLMQWLDQNQPQDVASCVIHGDWR
ncbi:MAG: phosphotransferase, partial [Actinobacteria bacterium]|nr:phosphotransferase [Actinomycetota bacterium]